MAQFPAGNESFRAMLEFDDHAALVHFLDLARMIGSQSKRRFDLTKRILSQLLFAQRYFMVFRIRNDHFQFEPVAFFEYVAHLPNALPRNFGDRKERFDILWETYFCAELVDRCNCTLDN